MVEIAIEFKGKRSFDTEEEAKDFRKTIGDKYRATYRVDYPDSTFFIVEFEE
jgi:hypothetical protein